MSELPPVIQHEPPPHPEQDNVRQSRRSQHDEDDEEEEEVTGLKTDMILPHPHRQSKLSQHSFQPRRNSQVSKLVASQQVRFMIMRAHQTPQFVVKKRWFVINPDTNRFSTAWQVITNLALAFVALITPLQVGLLEIELDALFVLTMLVDFVFVVDMVLQFVTMYPRTTARGLEWELRPQKIAKNYLRTWFFLDFVTLIPFDMIGLTSGTDSLKDLRSIKVIRVLRLLKLMRLLRSSRLTHRLEIPLSIPYQQVALFRFLLILVLACHWLACVWAMTLKIVEDTFPQWINDIEAADLPYGIRTRDSPLRIYIAAYYFCCYTMTSVGYGDNGPKNVLER
ncbi:KCNH6, partial [Symbiodinium pilosum]